MHSNKEEKKEPFNRKEYMKKYMKEYMKKFLIEKYHGDEKIYCSVCDKHISPYYIKTHNKGKIHNLLLINNKQ